MTDDLRDHLRGMADSAAARTSDLDTGRFVEFIGAARRRRDQRQRLAVGGLALALVGGVAYGGMQIFGDGDAPMVATAYSDNVFCGWSGPASTEIGVEGEEQLISVISPEGSSDAAFAPDRSLETGSRTFATRASDLDLQLFNSTDEAFEGSSVVIDLYVMSQDKVIAAAPRETDVEPLKSVTLLPGQTMAVPVRSPSLCPGESYEETARYQLYAVATVIYDGDGSVEEWRSTFGAVNAMGFATEGPVEDIPLSQPNAMTFWGGPWTVGPLTDDPSLIEPEPILTEYSDSPYCLATALETTLVDEPSTERLVTVASPEQPGQLPANLNRELARGDRMYATSIDDLELQLLNATGVEFTGLDIAIDVYVMGADGMVAAPPTSASTDTTNVIGLDAESLLAVPIRQPVLCPGQSYEEGKEYQVIAHATATYPEDSEFDHEEWRDIFRGNNSKGFSFYGVDDPPEINYDFDALHIWGGPWSVGPLTGAPTEIEPDPQPQSELTPVPVEDLEAMGYTRLDSTCRMYDPEVANDPVDWPCPLVAWTALEGKSVTPSQLNSEVFYFSLATGADGVLVSVDAHADAWLNIGIGTGGDGMIAPSLRLDFTSLGLMHHEMAYPATIDVGDSRWQALQPLEFGDQVTTIDVEFDNVRNNTSLYIGGIDGKAINMVSEMVSFTILQENLGWETAGAQLEATCQPYERHDDQSVTFADDTVECPVDFIIPPELTEQPQTLDSLRQLITGLRLRDDSDPLRLLILERVEVTITSDGEPVTPPIIGDFDTLPIHQRYIDFDAESPFAEIGAYHEFITTDSGSLPDGELTVTFALNLEQVHTSLDPDGSFDSTSLRLTTSPIHIQATH